MGLYQISKVAVAPAVLLFEYVLFGKTVTVRIMLAIALVCAGVGFATVTSPELGSSSQGVWVGLGAVVATALFQIWAGSKQTELRASSMQLLHQVG